jgi:diguanylate cyclase (GGDEF)-like protein
VAGRYGGEEFLAVLPETEAAAALAAAEHIRSGIKSLTWLKPGLHVNVSAGICEYARGMTSDSLVDCADRRLYEAKKAGRDRVVG